MSTSSLAFYRLLRAECVGIFVAALAAALGGCDKGGTIHPTAAGMPHAGSVTSVLMRGNRPISTELTHEVECLRAAARIQTIGQTDGPAGEFFSKIADVAVDSEFRVFVLDAGMGAVRIFSATGTYVNSITASGSAGFPRQPLLIEFVAPDELVVSDGRNASAHSMRHGFQRVWSGTLGFVSESLCAAAQLHVRGFTPAGSLHSISPSGLIDRTYGDIYSTPNRLLASQLSAGPMGCVHSGGLDLVLAAFDWLPFVSGYDTNGHRLWTSKFEGLNLRVALESRHGQVLLPLVQDLTYEFDEPVSIVGVGGPYFLAQVARRNAIELLGIRSFLIDGRDGMGAFIGEELPMVLAARGTRLYAVVAVPFQHVEVYELTL